MNEVAVNFGPGGYLSGTLTLPDPATKPVALLLCNAGVIHRMGPHRINVKLARRLAERGYPVLRMDLAGQGDSDRPQSNLPFDKQSVVDLQAGMDHVKRVTGVHRFAMAGICSGAHHGLSLALADDRLVALWMLDGYAYSTPRTLRVRMARQVELEPVKTVSRWLARPARGLVAALARPFAAKEELAAETRHPTPTKAEFAAMIRTLAQRSVHLRVVYSGSMFWQFNYPEQWRDAFAEQPTVAGVPCDYIPQIDHTLTSVASQQIMIESVSGWLAGLK